MPAPNSNSDSNQVAAAQIHWALALLDGLITAGVTTLVLSPGSRSTPVILAAQQRPTALALIPILDERSAAFFALGHAQARGAPVALLATSGSAPAHWYPAVIEASTANVPLVLLSADRPPALQQFGANQTIDQTRLFGQFVREFHAPGLPENSPAALKAAFALGLRAATRAKSPMPGPVHLNLAFAEPLVADVLPRPEPPLLNEAGGFSENGVRTAGDLHLPRGRGLIVCGAGDYATDCAAFLWQAAAQHGWPVLPDVLSGLRFGATAAGHAPANRIRSYDTLLRNPTLAAHLRPDWVLRLGRAPVSKVLTEWLRGVPALLVSPDASWSDPTHDVRWCIHATPAAVCRQLATTPPQVAPETHQLNAWHTAEQRMTALMAELLNEAHWCEAHCIQDLFNQLPPTDALLCANSLPIRQLDTWTALPDLRPTAALRVFGNRGVSGIDGQLSTLAGLNHAGQPTWGLIGDLSFCHDVSGLFLAPRFTRPLIIINNGGGRIFDYLPQRQLTGLETLWRTPQQFDLSHLAKAFYLTHSLIDDRAHFQQLLMPKFAELSQIAEVRIDPEQSRAVHLDLWERVRTV
ncbi:2-succinyl-5-enolpyruvyl-6-hydroxy-3-cyclohexene-1-carboxylic-acid synthase [Rhodoferax sp. 4810]|uniref:2-succinyl-5-enolpyruvyl-6-hydroxy-3-cyclohexene-1-carboxylate synthase n=1 Tax=Thiospirillum jenense TaxID=1653858 RepID=A0A839HD79_9GAMM|nr:2-succinyl-5-enolpyruvyl-6-hydroxy-3-cyclohexene-1-carboxylic-acid synthase [Thiospirillum jenense]MBB1073837.1 2-succinyl-5-enolpyruvyl-6-hydroxy-3-cyclohexene-1-carboxylic-acid synthase [Rhodoferax jenense]MBB1125208.1 2-succinyl-5-enolpyruvyl-6-hydroxy-3-cyclohexene-1-carboxylic-acid synthase [Thiospirillum jenense]